ncbi:MAG: Yip1 family protein [Candidatus Altiarchaeota archaeon]
MGLFEHAIGVVISPTDTFEELADEKPVGEAAFITVGIPVIFSALFFLLFIPMLSAMGPVAGFLGMSMALIIPGFALAAFIIWLFSSLIFHVVLKVFGGQGSLSAMMCVLSFSSVVGFVGQLLSIPFVFISGVTGDPTIYFFVNILVSFWFLYTFTTGASIANRISRARVVVALIAFAFIVGFIFFILGVGGILSFAPSIDDIAVHGKFIEESGFPITPETTISTALPYSTFPDYTTTLFSTSSSLTTTTSIRIITKADLIFDCTEFCQRQNYTVGKCVRSLNLCKGNGGVNFRQADNYCEHDRPLETCCCFEEG